MNIELIYEHTICTAYISAIVNGDYSGLEENEDLIVDNYLATLPDNYIFDYGDEESFFARDEISGLMAECVDCKIYAPAPIINKL